MSVIQGNIQPGALIELRKRDSIRLLREARPFLRGAPGVFSIRISRDEEEHPWFSEDKLRELYFYRSSLRPDTMIIHDLPMREGTLRAVTVYAEQLLFPIEYLMLLRCRIPRAAFLSLNGWKSVLGDEKEDNFCQLLNEKARAGSRLNLDSMFPFFGWSAFRRRARIRLPWIYQIVPFGLDQSLFVYQREYMAGFLASGGKQSFHVEKAIQASRRVEAAISEFGYQGLAGRPEAIHATLSMIAVPEMTRRESLPVIPETWVIEAAKTAGP